MKLYDTACATPYSSFQGLSPKGKRNASSRTSQFGPAVASVHSTGPEPGDMQEDSLSIEVFVTLTYSVLLQNDGET